MQKPLASAYRASTRGKKSGHRSEKSRWMRVSQFCMHTQYDRQSKLSWRMKTSDVEVLCSYWEKRIKHASFSGRQAFLLQRLCWNGTEKQSFQTERLCAFNVCSYWERESSNLFLSTSKWALVLFGVKWTRRCLVASERRKRQLTNRQIWPTTWVKRSSMNIRPKMITSVHVNWFNNSFCKKYFLLKKFSCLSLFSCLSVISDVSRSSLFSMTVAFLVSISFLFPFSFLFLFSLTRSWSCTDPSVLWVKTDTRVWDSLVRHAKKVESCGHVHPCWRLRLHKRSTALLP